ncbi:serine hydrolase [Paracoccus denitrificans]|uniref:D-alanyl-D-alanine carboxypeptidase family protein n=1 Tax=Paracoccus denitrificans TaxID=266 RepID=UPI001E47F514|nr:serine hydrolase [Paracoccus denitrificans]UFS63850.1 serine hydrolase [Paracoccus denitrificans]
MTGVTSINLSLTNLADEVLVNFQGSTRRMLFERLIAMLMGQIGPTHPTRAELLADLDWPAGAQGTVYDDPNPALNGTYRKSGVFGGGSWIRTGDLPGNAVGAAMVAALRAELADSGYEQAAFTEDYDAIAKSGTYRDGGAAVGNPWPGVNAAVLHIEHVGGRAWQMAFQANLGAPEIASRYRNDAGLWTAWNRSRTDANTGEFGRSAQYSADFDAISVSGDYYGLNAIGAPIANAQLMLRHLQSIGGRVWQECWMAAEADQVPRGWRRYRTSTGEWTIWIEISTAANSATAEQGRKADNAVPIAAGHPLALFMDGSGGAIYDFTDRIALGIDTTADTPGMVRDMLGGPPLTVNGTAPKPVLDSGRLVLRSVEATDQLVRATPLLPETGDVVLAWSHKSESTGAKAVIWQHQTGIDGRVLITANVRRTASNSFVETNNRLQVYMQGATDGGGEDGGIAHVPHPIGHWSDFVLVLKAGTRASELWVNGNLMDTFTRPATIPQVVTAFLRHSSQPGVGGCMGRVLCLCRAPAEGEIAVIRSWLREGFAGGPGGSGGAWIEPVITASAAILHSKPIPGHDAGEIWSKAGDTVLRPASMTKLLTAHVALNWLKKLDALDTLFERQLVDQSAGSGSNLDVGDTLDLTNALANLGLPSSNVTANVVARVVGELILASESASGDGYDRFVVEMNAEAARLGMTASTWNNPTGGDSTGGGNYTTARDMARLCVVVGETHPEITSIWANATWDLQIAGPNPRTVMITHSVDFIEHGDPRVTWGKTGTTPLGGNCLLCEFRGPKGNRFYYVGFQASTDASRFADADAVFAAAEVGVEWPSLIPQLRQS